MDNRWSLEHCHEIIFCTSQNRSSSIMQRVTLAGLLLSRFLLILKDLCLRTEPRATSPTPSAFQLLVTSPMVFYAEGNRLMEGRNRFLMIWTVITMRICPPVCVYEITVPSLCLHLQVFSLGSIDYRTVLWKLLSISLFLADRLLASSWLSFVPWARALCWTDVNNNPAISPSLLVQSQKSSLWLILQDLCLWKDGR